MGQTVLTCEQVDERDLEAGYVAGRLSEEDAAAFEEHFFGCERCWTLVKAAQGIAAAARPATRAAYKRKRWYLAPLAAAAVLALVVAGRGWLNRQSAPLATETLRGANDSISVNVAVSASGLTVHVVAFPGADLYRVRVFSPKGDVLAEREVSDTTFAIAVSVPTSSLVQVTALDVLRQPLASSGLVPVRQ